MDNQPPQHTPMTAALAQAGKALARGDFPVGCVIADGDRIVASGHRSGTAHGGRNELDHAEIVALRALEQVDPALERSALTAYCTLEPCLMCFGALMIAGIGRIVFAYEDPMGGGTGCPRQALPPLYRDHVMKIVGGVGRADSLNLFKQFFRNPNQSYLAGTFFAQSVLNEPDKI